MNDAAADRTRRAPREPETRASGGTPGGALDKGRALFRSTEVDARLFGLVVALGVSWIAFDIASGIWGQGGKSVLGGSFLTPRNLWNLSVQTASIAVMATGMVLVIVSRNIDLSVGSLLGFLAMVMGITQKEILPAIIGFESELTWIITLGVGIAVGAAIGAGQGFIIAYLGVPAFIVTLGGCSSGAAAPSRSPRAGRSRRSTAHSARSEVARRGRWAA